MMTPLRNLIERQILKARAEGRLTGLQGEGQPLPDRPEAALVDPGVAVGMRIMAEAGVRPEEFRLKEELQAARAALAAMESTADRKAAMRRIADLEMRYNRTRDARRAFFR
ncbi:DnaJ family domain-containing protein [Sedimentitalea sp. HM32M-2]|uniref:DnaJ family domain-containing protein n=1 Tax=Sedimentitalea sp. HM32M-2 TaxID=3351566 RepID=UPI003629A5A9